MTSVAQRIDDDNRVLMKKNQELKIQFLSQDNDKDLLLRQLIFHKKENVNLRDVHKELRAKVEMIKSAEKADDEAARLLEMQKMKKNQSSKGGRMANRQVSQ